MARALTLPRELRDIWSRPNTLYEVEPEVKRSVHRRTARFLRQFAAQVLQIPDELFDVRSNLGGIAVSGEVTLHTEPWNGSAYGLYLQISCPVLLGMQPVMWRACRNKIDYSGYQNRFVGLEVFTTEERIQQFVQLVRLVIRRPLTRS